MSAANSILRSPPLAVPTSPVTLKLEVRADHRRHLRALRRQGRLPAVVYGHKVDSLPVVVDGREFIKAFQKVGRTQLLDLHIGDELPRKALIREVQRSPRDGDLLHIDFYQVNLLEKIESEIPLEFEGEIELVAKGEADLLQALHQLKVECLPTDLPPSIAVDVTGLKEIGDELRVKDLKLPPGVEVRDDPDELVVKVQAHREEVEEVVPAPAPAEVPTVSETEAAKEQPPEAETPA